MGGPCKNLDKLLLHEVTLTKLFTVITTYKVIY
jgi:hypothetical protein